MEKTKKERLNQILHTQLPHGHVCLNGIKGPDDIKHEHHLEQDLGADSLDLVELLMCVEEEFDIEVKDEVAETWGTVGDVYRYLGA